MAKLLTVSVRFPERFCGGVSAPQVVVWQLTGGKASDLLPRLGIHINERRNIGRLMVQMMRYLMMMPPAFYRAKAWKLVAGSWQTRKTREQTATERPSTVHVRPYH